METKKVIGFYDYTVVLTYLGMIFAFVGILKVLNGEYVNSMICLMGAGICDMFDGTVASTKDRNCYEKHFGIQIDSLCDLISFGVLPALFVYEITGRKLVVGVISCIYVLCGLIRLAYFNVQEFERQKMTEDRREEYLGVPITTSAIILPLSYLIISGYEKAGDMLFPVVLVILGCGFISEVKIKKPKIAGKAIMVLFGIAEFMGLFLLSGVDIL